MAHPGPRPRLGSAVDRIKAPTWGRAHRISTSSPDDPRSPRARAPRTATDLEVSENPRQGAIMKLNESVVAVTGGASGLGLATAQRLVDMGARVALVDLPGSDGKAEAEALGKGAIFAAGDVTDEQSFAAALDAAASLGPLRGVVHW